MKKYKIVTVGNLARNATYFTEVLNNKYKITNIITNNEENINSKKDILLCRQDNPIFLIIKIVKAYYHLLKADLIVSFTASITSPIFSFFFVNIKVKKYVAYATGSDLREGIYFKSKGLLIRGFFKKADLVVFHNNDIQTLKSIKLLGLKNIYWTNNYKQTEFNKNYIDDNYISNSIFLSNIKNFIGESFCIFMPSSIDFRKAKKRKNYYNSKGNDLAYEAIIKFVKKFPETKIILRDSGLDATFAKKILKPIKNNIIFIKTLSKKDLINLIYISDVIIDNLKLGAFGGIAIETASISKPLLTLPPNNNFYKYDKHPFLVNKSANDIYKNLLNLYDDKNYRLTYGKLCQKWILRNHSKEEYIKLAKIFDNLILNKSFKIIKNNGGYFEDI